MSPLKKLLVRQRKKLKQEPKFGLAFKIKLVTAGIDQATLLINGLFFLPLYLKYLGIEVYGYWLATGGILIWMGIFNFATITSQRVAAAYGCKDYKKCADYYWTGLKIYGWLAIIVILIGWGVSLVLPSMFDIPKPFDFEIVQAFQIAAFAMLLQLFGACSVSFVSSIERPQVLLFTSFVALVLQIVVVPYGLLSGWGVSAIAAGLFAQAIFKTFTTISVASWYAFALAGKARFSKPVFMDYMDNLPSSCLRAIGAGVSLRMQPTLITLILGPTVAAAYDITSKAILLIQSIMSRIVISAFSRFSSLLSQKNKTYAWSRIEKSFFIFQLCVLGAIIGYVIFNRSFISLWVGKKYFLGNSITLAIGIGALVSMYTAFFNLIIMCSGALKQSGNLSFMRAVTSIVASYLGLHFGGIIGLPLALFANELFYLFIHRNYLSNLGGNLFKLERLSLYKWAGAIGIIVVSSYLSSMVFFQTWTGFIIWTSVSTVSGTIFIVGLGGTKLKFEG